MRAYPVFLLTGLVMASSFALAEDAIHHGDAHHAAAGDHATVGLPQLDLTWFPSQMFWLGIAFIILYTSFSGKILPAFAAGLQDREQTIRNDLETADDLTKEAANFQKTYEEGLQNARADAAKMMVDLDLELRKKQEENHAKFLKKTETMIGETKAHLDQMTKSSMTDIESHIEDAAQLAAKNIAGISSDGKAVKAALKSANTNIKTKAA